MNKELDAGCMGALSALMATVITMTVLFNSCTLPVLRDVHVAVNKVNRAKGDILTIDSEFRVWMWDGKTSVVISKNRLMTMAQEIK